MILLRPAHRILLGVTFGTVLLVGACASPAGENGLPFGDTSTRPTPSTTEANGETPTTFTVVNPDVEFNSSDDTMIAFQGSWVCEFQRRTFAQPSDGEAALDVALEDAGINREAYDDFLARSADNQDLRSAILFAYQQSCKP